MRLIFALATLPLPAVAWEFSPDPVCTLSHVENDVQVVVTYDPTLPEYAILVVGNSVWPEGIFFITFEGAAPLTISTDRQRVTADGTHLTVRDRGFGNVLDGLEFNDIATAGVGNTTVSVSLDGIEPAITAFRACPADSPATS